MEAASSHSYEVTLQQLLLSQVGSSVVSFHADRWVWAGRWWMPVVVLSCSGRSVRLVGDGGVRRGRGQGGWLMVLAPRSSIKSIPRSEKKWRRTSLPSIVLDHVSQLNDELSLFVLLTALKRVLIFPAQGGFTVFTVDISHSM